MNFKRIEWIFLVAFIVLDFFLMTTYFHQDSIVESTTNTSTQDSTASLMKSLKNDQISHGKLSDKSQSGYYLAAPKDGFLREKAAQLRYVTWSYSNHKLTASFITGIRLNLTNPQNSLDSVVKDAALTAIFRPKIRSSIRRNFTANPSIQAKDKSGLRSKTAMLRVIRKRISMRPIFCAKRKIRSVKSVP